MSGIGHEYKLSPASGCPFPLPASPDPDPSLDPRSARRAFARAGKVLVMRSARFRAVTLTGQGQGLGSGLAGSKEPEARRARVSQKGRALLRFGSVNSPKIALARQGFALSWFSATAAAA